VRRLFETKKSAVIDNLKNEKCYGHSFDFSFSLFMQLGMKNRSRYFSEKMNRRAIKWKY